MDTYRITLSDGTVLDGLELNGNNFISQTKITKKTFTGKLGKVLIEGPGNGDIETGEHGPMELVQVAHYKGLSGLADGWYFILRDVEGA